MSRRRPLPPPAPGAVRVFTFKIVCSHRGARPVEVLHHLADMRGHDHPEAFKVLEGRNSSPVSTYRQDGAVRYVFRCGQCPNEKRIREQDLIRRYDELVAASDGAGHPVLDIDELPLRPVALAPVPGRAD